MWHEHWEILMPSGTSRAVPDAGHLAALRRTAAIALFTGACGSVALMLRAGRRQQSKILLLLFGIWVLCPFVTAAIANSFSKRWATPIQMTLCGLALILTLGSLAIYGSVAFGYLNAKA